MKKPKDIKIIIGGILFVLCTYSVVIFMQTREHVRFHESAIHGVVNGVQIMRGGHKINVAGDKGGLFIGGFKSISTTDFRLEDYLKLGDTINKCRGTDTLIINSNGEPISFVYVQDFHFLTDWYIRRLDNK